MEFKVGDSVFYKRDVRKYGKITKIDCGDIAPYTVKWDDRQIEVDGYNDTDLQLADCKLSEFKVGDKVRIIQHQDQDGKIERVDIYNGKETYFVRCEEGASMYYPKDLQKILPKAFSPDKYVYDDMIIRDQLKWFSILMEAKLQRCDSKKDSLGWRNKTVKELYEMLNGEIYDLHGAYENCDSVGIIEECTDVANFCMMIADSIFTRSQNREKK